MIGCQSRTDNSSKESAEWKGGEGRSWLFVALAMGSFPGFVIKQFVNFAQIRAAVSSLMSLDLERDRKKGVQGTAKKA